MKPSDYRNGNQLRWRVDRFRLGLRNRGVTIQSLMRPRDVIIVVDVLLEQPIKMCLAQDNDVVEELPA